MPPAPTSSVATAAAASAASTARATSAAPEAARRPPAEPERRAPSPAVTASDKGAAAASAANAEEDEDANGDGEGIINFETFNQILELDDEDEFEFSWAMADAFFQQATTTFGDMDDAYERKDLDKLSSLGHFLKGSSAALGVARVQDSCEKIQHYGHLRDEETRTNLTSESALKKIGPLLVLVKKDFAVAERWLRKWFKEHGVDEAVNEDE